MSNKSRPALEQRRPRRGKGAFWESPSIAELAARQGIKPVQSIDDMLGGWPEDELDDGFEKAVAAWRRAELERGA